MSECSTVHIGTDATVNEPTVDPPAVEPARTASRGAPAAERAWPSWLREIGRWRADVLR